MSEAIGERTIIWENPPETREHRDYSWFYEELRTNPERWARYPGTQAGASNWCLTHDGYEYTSKQVGDERRVWMRYRSVRF